MTALILTLAGPAAGTEKPDSPVYRYIDRDGILNFTDDPGRIPPEYQSSAEIVELPPAIKMPESVPVPPPEKPSFLTRTRTWFAGWPGEYLLVGGGILPLAALSVWVLLFFRKRVDSPFMKVLLRIGMVAIIMASLYLCYFLIMRAQATKWIGPIPEGSDLRSLPKRLIESLEQQESERLKRIDEVTGSE